MGHTIRKIKDELEKIIKPTSHVLDIGCGIKTHSNYSHNTTTIDAWDKLEPDIRLDVTKEKLPFKENSFDIITMIDFIEHLDKESGENLLVQCKEIARDKIIIYTPLFFDDNSRNVENPSCWAYGNPYDYHRSVWSLEEDFAGWVTIGTKLTRLGECWLGYWEKK